MSANSDLDSETRRNTKHNVFNLSQKVHESEIVKKKLSNEVKNYYFVQLQEEVIEEVLKLLDSHDLEISRATMTNKIGKIAREKKLELEHQI
jgi:hypothetical protein